MPRTLHRKLTPLRIPQLTLFRDLVPGFRPPSGLTRFSGSASAVDVPPPLRRNQASRASPTIPDTRTPRRPAQQAGSRLPTLHRHHAGQAPRGPGRGGAGGGHCGQASGRPTPVLRTGMAAGAFSAEHRPHARIAGKLPFPRPTGSKTTPASSARHAPVTHQRKPLEVAREARGARKPAPAGICCFRLSLWATNTVGGWP
jgi:hypothetical protein